MKHALTYAEMPEKDIFLRHFEQEAGDSYTYELRGGDAKLAATYRIEPADELDGEELYEMIQFLVFSQDEDAIDLAGSFLSTLNIEWV